MPLRPATDTRQVGAGAQDRANVLSAEIMAPTRIQL
jgi:hypothetical protein